MSCEHPLIRFYNPNDHNITGSIMSLKMARERFRYQDLQYEDLAYRPDVMLLPCGRCISCRIRMRQDWQTRMELEAKGYPPEEIWFLTFTYDQESVPSMTRSTGELWRGGGYSWKGGSEAPECVQTLLMEDIVLFNKKLRRRQEIAGEWGKELRYFYAGEYGEKTGRPHYHGIYYGLRIPDIKKDRGANPYYTSESLESLWKYGHITIAQAVPETYGYVAGYVTKKMYNQDNKRYSELGLQPPQAAQSRNPGLGMRWYQEHKEELWQGKIYLSGGKVAPVPRYFEKMLEQEDPKRLWAIKAERQRQSIEALKDEARQTGQCIQQRRETKNLILKQKFSKTKGII